MSQELRQAHENASKVKNRVDQRRVSVYQPGSSSQDPDVPMPDLESVYSPYQNVVKPSTQRKRTSRERREKSDNEDSFSESESESESISEDEEQMGGSQHTGPRNV